ncbi:MAG: acyltransferase [Fimbriimonas sp.]
MEPEALAKPKRDATFDIAKGIGILSVIVLHWSSNAARLYSTEGAKLWWGLKLLNLFVNYAVPLFLVVSGVLWTQSLARKWDFGGTIPKRFVSVAYPLLIWSIIGFLYTSRTSGGMDYLLDFNRRLPALVYGKASYHLYFLVIMCQFALVGPLLAFALKKLPLWGAMVLAVGLQALIFWLQKAYFRMPSPGSMVLWHSLTLLPAIWLGLDLKTRLEGLRKIRVPVLVLAVLATAGFMYLSAGVLQKEAVDGLLLNWTAKVHGLLVAMAILGLCSGSSRWFEWLGENSLQLYLVHPTILGLLASPRFVAFFAKLPLAPIWPFLITLGGSIAVALIARLLRLDGVLFGRWTPRKKVEPAAQAV